MLNTVELNHPPIFVRAANANLLGISNVLYTATNWKENEVYILELKRWMNCNDFRKYNMNLLNPN